MHAWSVAVVVHCPGQSMLWTENPMSHPDCESVVAGDVDDEGSLRQRVATSELAPIDDGGRDAAVSMTISMPLSSRPRS